MGKLPAPYERFQRIFRRVWKAYDSLGAAVHQEGPLDPKARELIAAFEEYARRGVYAFTFRGQMVDAPHLARARKLLARAGME